MKGEVSVIKTNKYNVGSLIRVEGMRGACNAGCTRGEIDIAQQIKVARKRGEEKRKEKEG